MDKLLGYITHPWRECRNPGIVADFYLCVLFVYWWFREQACIVVCPYGRLQGVLLDKNSIVVAYDYLRVNRGTPEKAACKTGKEEDHDCKCTDCKGNGACKDMSARFEPVVKQGIVLIVLPV